MFNYTADDDDGRFSRTSKQSCTFSRSVSTFSKIRTYKKLVKKTGKYFPNHHYLPLPMISIDGLRAHLNVQWNRLAGRALLSQWIRAF